MQFSHYEMKKEIKYEQLVALVETFSYARYFILNKSEPDVCVYIYIFATLSCKCETDFSNQLCPCYTWYQSQWSLTSMVLLY